MTARFVVRSLHGDHGDHGGPDGRVAVKIEVIQLRERGDPGPAYRIDPFVVRVAEVDFRDVRTLVYPVKGSDAPPLLELRGLDVGDGDVRLEHGGIVIPVPLSSIAEVAS